MRLFLLRRLCALAMVTEGLMRLVCLPGLQLNLRVARRIARLRGMRMIEDVAAEQQREYRESLRQTRLALTGWFCLTVAYEDGHEDRTFYYPTALRRDNVAANLRRFSGVRRVDTFESFEPVGRPGS
jgi:hypothetical protein